MKRFNNLAFIIGVLTVIITILAWYLQFRERDYRTLIYTDLTRSRLETEELKEAATKINELLEQKIAEAPQRVESASIEQKFKNLEERISSVQQQTVGLRQAINPSSQEILTIARLNDETKALRKDLANLESNLSSQQKSFQESILRELKASSESKTLILVVLVPLVLNFLYSVWKDFRSAKGEKSEP